MTSTLTTELQKGLQAVNEADSPETGIGLLIADSMNRRLIESASAHLDLKCIVLDKDKLSVDVLAPLEMIVTDTANVDLIQDILAGHQDKGDGPNPAVISVTISDDCTESQAAQGIHPYDGVLCLPQSPAQLAAQLSLTLYSHRAFARRYHNALEELNLNRRIFRSVTSGISVASATEPDLPLTYVNPAFEAMTGYSLEEVIGKNCRFLQGEGSSQPAIDLLRTALRERREVVVILKNYRKDGTPFWNELSLSPIRNREGEVTHFVGIQTDVTARVEFEAALRESEKLAAVGRLASSIAHEINNPLESVMNLVYLAAHSDDTDETKKYLALADAELQRVKLITAQSLRFFKQSTKPQSVQCSELLNSVLDLYASRLVNAGVTIERKDRRSQPLTCMESEIRQVLNNLVGNAIDAMQSGDGGRLIIRTREATDWQSGQRGVLFTLADTGSGIDSENLASIFRPFFTTKGAQGTGLGLWISSGIVDRHNGRLKARSRQGNDSSGTVFEMFLPFDGQLKPLPEALKTGFNSQRTVLF